MRIFAKKHLREFWESRKGDSGIAERDLTAWWKIAKDAHWQNFGDLQQTFGADKVGNCTVFDVGNNRFRLIARVNYLAGKIYVLKIMDHKEYDRNEWPRTCNCHKPPPKLEPPKTVEPGKPTRKGKLK